MRITKTQLAGVDRYKYSGVDKSVLSKFVLGPFWTWLVTLFPRSLAPNMVSGLWVVDDRRRLICVRFLLVRDAVEWKQSRVGFAPLSCSTVLLREGGGVS